LIWYLERNCTRVSTCQRPDDVSVGLCMTLEIYTKKILWINIMYDTNHNRALFLAFSKSTHSIWYVRMSLVIKYVELTGDTCHFPMSILKNRKIATVQKVPWNFHCLDFFGLIIIQKLFYYISNVKCVTKSVNLTPWKSRYCDYIALSISVYSRIQRYLNDTKLSADHKYEIDMK